MSTVFQGPEEGPQQYKDEVLSSAEFPQPGFEHAARLSRNNREEYKRGLKALAIAIASAQLELPPETFNCFDGRPEHAGAKASPLNRGLKTEFHDEFYLFDSRILKADTPGNENQMGVNMCLLHCRIVDTKRGLVPVVTPYRTADGSGHAIANEFEKKLSVEVPFDQMEAARAISSDPLKRRNSDFASILRNLRARVADLVDKNPIPTVAVVGTTIGLGVIGLGSRAIHGHILNLQLERSTQLKRLVDAGYTVGLDGTIKVDERVIEQIDVGMLHALHGELHSDIPKRQSAAIKYLVKWGLAEYGNPRELMDVWWSFTPGPGYSLSELTAFIKETNDPELVAEAVQAKATLKAEVERIIAAENKKSLAQMDTKLAALSEAKSKRVKILIINQIYKQELAALTAQLDSPAPAERIDSAKKLVLFGKEFLRSEIDAPDASDRYVSSARESITNHLQNEHDAEVRSCYVKLLEELSNP